MRAEPIVNGLEKEWGQSVQVVQVNIHEAENKALIDRVGALFTPTFILFDAAGEEVWRTVGSIEADQVKEQVEAMQGP